MWSDSCVPQNKNSVTSFALQHFQNSKSSQQLEIIEFFSEPSQDIMVHIQLHRKALEIWNLLDLIKLLSSMSKNWKNEFIILLVYEKKYPNVPYSKVFGVKLIHAKARVKKSKVSYRLNNDGTVKLTASILQIKKKHRVEMLTYIPNKKDRSFFETLLKVKK